MQRCFSGLCSHDLEETMWETVSSEIMCGEELKKCVGTKMTLLASPIAKDRPADLGALLRAIDLRSVAAGVGSPAEHLFFFG